MGLNTELGERKLTILKAIIQNYLETGEPVGSRTLSKYMIQMFPQETETIRLPEPEEETWRFHF